MEKRYEWRELSEDGLLRKSPECGPRYDRETINGYCGFSTEEEALAAYAAFKKAHKYGVPNELVLVALYKAPDVDA
ncbi:MAG: hypothetical protein ACK52I_29940 [Pseudomonadota bacterium]|jgi:hypothetical protein